jgi:peptide/nickel transport system substrate-binding protein
MIRKLLRQTAACLAITMVCLGGRGGQSQGSAAEFLVTDGEPGVYGGRLVIAQRAEPKTLHPVFAVDNPSRELIRLMTSDLIHINRFSQKTEPGLAKSWTISKDGRQYNLQLRKGLLFSDGHPMDADDVIFSFQVYLDERNNSPQRDLLRVGGQPIRVSKTGPHAVQFELAQPYAAAERLFDSVAILPQHLMEKAYREGTLSQTWGVTADRSQVAGLGPFRLKTYIPGDRMVLERNPHYWKVDRKGNRLPYLDEVVLLFVGSEDAQVMRFQTGETDVISRISPENYSLLAKEQATKGYRLYDLGPGLEYNFLFFNLNDLKSAGLSQVARRQAWFQQRAFRQAVSAAIDRDGIVRLVYQGRGSPLWGHVTPGNSSWINSSLARPPRSIAKGREILAKAGFKWNGDGSLVDPAGMPVEFSIVASSSNATRMQMATIVQADLKQLGMQVHVVPLEFRSLLDRVLKTYDYEACLLGLVGGDADPNPDMNVLASNGSTHLWHPAQTRPATSWEEEIDQLMMRQMSTLAYPERKRLYDQVQQLMSDELPLICLASPDILVGAKNGLGNFKPAVLEDYVLWNAEMLYWNKNLSRD